MRDYLAAVGASNVGVVIASHNHADHIGGLATVLDSGISASTQVYIRVLKSAPTPAPAPRLGANF